MLYRAIVGTLIARTGVHVGSGNGEEITDAECRRDAAGQYILPGTALGGALRAIATRLAPQLGHPACKALQDENRLSSPCGCPVCKLFGEINPGTQGNTEPEIRGGRASLLVVNHAVAQLPDGRGSRIRDGVGIERSSRTAARAEAAKFDLEVLPRGTAFSLRLELEDEPDETGEQLLAAVLAEWQAGRAWIGGRAARGLGAFDLQGVKQVTRVLSTADGLLAYLRTDTPWESAQETPDWLHDHLLAARQSIPEDRPNHLDYALRSFVSFRFELKFTGLFLANDSMAAGLSEFDQAPLLEVVAKEGAPILPGASLRGVLRSQAERMARTLATLRSDDACTFGVVCPACDPLRRPGPEEDASDVPLASCDALLRGQVRTDQIVSDQMLCLGCRLFGSTRRGSRLFVEDAYAASATPRKVLDFLAIDRFTGGGKEGAKFDALDLWKPVFPVRLHLENPAPWELGWIYLVLRDLTDQMVGLGAGAAKGVGQATTTNLTVACGVIRDEDFSACDEAPSLVDQGVEETASGLFSVRSWGAPAAGSLRDLADGWVAEFYRACQVFERPDKLRLKKDSYFHEDLPTLYEKEAVEWLLRS